MHRRAILGLAAAWVTARARAQATRPSRPIRLVWPFPPGGDFIGRRLAEQVTRSLGHPVVVENRSGAGGILGSDLVAKAPPDGHTLLCGNIASHAVAPAVYRTVPYHPLLDFTHIARVGLGQDDHRRLAGGAAGLAVRGRRRLPSAGQHREDARRHPAYRRGPLALAAGDRRLDRRAPRRGRARCGRLLGAAAGLSGRAARRPARCAAGLPEGRQGSDLAPPGGATAASCR